MNQIFKNVLNFFNDHMDTVYVLLSAGSSISIWWLQVEFGLKVLVSLLTAVYISIKIYKLSK